MKYCTLSVFIFLIAFGVQVRAQGNLTLEAQVTVTSQNLRPCEEFKIGIITPPKEIDFKMTIVHPNPNVDFKGIIIKPCEESKFVALTPSVNIFFHRGTKTYQDADFESFPCPQRSLSTAETIRQAFPAASIEATANHLYARMMSELLGAKRLKPGAPRLAYTSSSTGKG